MRASSATQAGVAVRSVRDPAGGGDGHRILVDRLWPRGVSKDRAALSEWLRDVAPSDALRRWFAHDPARWEEFKRRYRDELAGGAGLGALRSLVDRSRAERITLLYGAHDREHNNAVALAGIIDEVLRER